MPKAWKSGEQPATFRARTTFNSTGVVIIDGLAPDDTQTATTLYDGLLHLRDSHGGQFATYRRVEDRESFLAILAGLRVLCQQGLRPIIHIEAHGDRDRGLEIGTGKELIAWSELADAFAEMNAITRNNLGVVISACHGFYAIQDIDIQKPCPFYFLIAPTEEVSTGLIVESMPAFYQTLLATHSFEHAEAKLGPNFQVFLAEKFFCITFARHMRDHGIGSGAQRRIEELVTKAVNEGKAPNRETIRSLRRRFREVVRSPEAIYYQMSREFLHGRRAGNFIALRDFVRRAYAT